MSAPAAARARDPDADSLESAAGPDGRGGWELNALLGLAALAVLPELFDVDAFKTSVVALFAAAVLLPWFALRARQDAFAWGRSPGFLLLAFSLLWSLQFAFALPPAASQVDRLLGVLLAQVAALAGLRAALRFPAALGRAVLASGLVVAVLALFQAVGVERVLTAGSEEVVSSFGNSTRAGLALAFVVVVAFAQLLAPRAADAAWRERYAAAALNLGLAALLLTRARGGWLAAACGVAAVAATCPSALWPRRRIWALPAGVGIALALVLGDGPGRLFAPKLPADSALVSVDDVTTQVRLSIWRGTLDMADGAPWSGHGLGRFRQTFPMHREAGEAALPGRHGLPTEVDHPHNEPLLALAEGGWPAAVALLAFALATLWRGFSATRPAPRGAPPDGDESSVRQGDRIAFGICVAGCVGALVQNAWTTTGTALVFFAAAGWLWRPRPGADGQSAPRTPRAAGRLVAIPLLAAAAVLFALAPARALVHWHWWRFFVQADAAGLAPDTLQRLVAAAEADPTDIDIQRRLVVLGEQVLEAFPQADTGLAAAVERARGRVRLALLIAPPAPTPVPDPDPPH